MKRSIVLLLSLMMLFCSCSGERTNETTTPKDDDWHNHIEYDGSFYVYDGLKLLYLLDQGRITLWDDAGDGASLQTLVYDSADPNAIESFRTEDINGDGYMDLFTSFDEGRENLWLWSEYDEFYLPCGGYRLLVNPRPDPASGTVACTSELENFGTVTTVYKFSDYGRLATVSATLENADEAAADICAAFFGNKALTLAPGTASIGEEDCPVYIVGEKEAYLTYDVTAPAWYADIGCIGLYRTIEVDGEGACELTYYLDDAGFAQEYAMAYAETEHPSLVSIQSERKGRAGGEIVTVYAFAFADQPLCEMFEVKGGRFYLCPDGEDTFYLFNGISLNKLSTLTLE